MRLVVFNELRGGTCILVCRFHLVGSSEGCIFVRFRGRPVVVTKLKGGICIIGRRFDLVASSKGDIFQA